jgi:radical SAM superfamily enzyme YgiQ (UPF0313 family)
VPAIASQGGMEGQRPLKVLFFLDYEDSLGGKFANSPGLLPLIGYARAHGFDVDFVASERNLLARLASDEIDVIAISSMERLLPRSIAVARRVRGLRPQAVLMIGGNAIDPFAADLASSLFDIVVLGEAEHIFPSLLHSIAVARGARTRTRFPNTVFVPGSDRRIGSGDPGPGLDTRTVDLILGACFERQLAPGLRARIRIGNTYVRDAERNVVWYLEEPGPADLVHIASTLARFESRPIETLFGSAPLTEELDGLCIEPWDILRREGWKHFEFSAQRGCRWGRCTFCSVSDREVRAQSPEKVVEVIRAAVENGAEMISFADDLFVQHRAWNIAVLEAIIAARLPRVEFRAQTMATASVRPLLGLMKRVGFSEIAFGVETLSAERAAFMAKSYNGEKYVANAKESTIHAAKAGINPVLYMIMTDPRSTLAEIARELLDTVQLCIDVFRMTGVVPKISYSLMMLPVASTAITAHFPYWTETIDLGGRCITMPTEFKVSPEVAAYLAAIGRRTETIPKRRENLVAFECYFDEIARVAKTHQLEDAPDIVGFAERGRKLLAILTGEIDSEIVSVSRSVARLIEGGREPDFDMQRLDYRWLGGYVPGIEKFARSIAQVHG